MHDALASTQNQIVADDVHLESKLVIARLAAIKLVLAPHVSKPQESAQQERDPEQSEKDKSKEPTEGEAVPEKSAKDESKEAKEIKEREEQKTDESKEAKEKEAEEQKAEAEKLDKEKSKEPEPKEQEPKPQEPEPNEANSENSEKDKSKEPEEGEAAPEKSEKDESKETAAAGSAAATSSAMAVGLQALRQAVDGDPNADDAHDVKSQSNKSAVSGLLALCANPELALKKYIASFSGSDTSAFGNSPPCQSYRHLVHMSTWARHRDAIVRAHTKQALTAVQDGMKEPKRAYTDLMTMARGACKRSG